MVSPRDWSPRKPLEFDEFEKKVFRGLVREFPEPERLWIASGANAYVWGAIQTILENRKISKEVEADLRKIQRDIEEILRGTPWWDQP